MRYLILAVIHTILFSSLAWAEPTVFLKDGTKVTGSSVWLEDDKVYLNRSSVLHEFGQEEVKLQETMKFNRIGTYQEVSIPGDHTVKPPPRRALQSRKPVAAVEGDTEKTSAAPASVTKPPAHPAPKSTVPPKPVAAPVTVTKEVAPPAAAPPAPTDVQAAPDKAELERRKQEATAIMVEAAMKKDPELMKKAVEMQKNLAVAQRGVGQPGGSFPIAVILLALAMLILIIVANWIIFERAGQAGWKCLIPIYNMYVLMLVAGKPWWWFLLLFVPLVGAVIYLLAMLSLAKKFGRSELFGVGLFLLPMIFMPLLAFSDSQYQG